MRYALGIEYDGSRYHGWQRQTNAVSVQQNVEKALSKIADEKVELTQGGKNYRSYHKGMEISLGFSMNF